MELPIFNDNLKSSGAWTARLATVRSEWQEIPTAGRDGVGRLIELELARRAGQLEATRLQQAASLVAGWVTEPATRLDRERLLELNRVLGGLAPEVDPLRTALPDPSELVAGGHDPVPARLLPRMLELAFDWFSTEGFDELHPVEQGTVVYLRLLDLAPFTVLTETTALLAAGFYTQRRGLPPLVITVGEEEQLRYRQALEAAFRMLTQPLVEYFADSLISSMSIAIERRGA